MAKSEDNLSPRIEDKLRQIMQKSTSPLIISHLRGGLGNQLFQWAFATHLSFITGSELSFSWDLHNGNRETTRAASLTRLGLDVGFRMSQTDTVAESEDFRTWFKPWGPLREWWFTSPIRDSAILGEPKSVESVLSNKRIWHHKVLHLVGYYQNEALTADGSKNLKKALLEGLRNCGAGIERPTAQAVVHVRRGDYVNRSRDSGFSALPAAYYFRAMARLRDFHGVNTFHVVSDDLDWVQNELCNRDFDLIPIRTQGSLAEFQDFAIMMSADYLVVSNSSFSRAASHFGGQTTEGRTIAPLNWGAEGSLYSKIRPNLNAPSTWVRV